MNGTVRTIALQKSGKTIIEIAAEDGRIFTGPVSTLNFNGHVCMVQPGDEVCFQQKKQNNVILLWYNPNTIDVALPDTEISTVYLVKEFAAYAYRNQCRCAIFVNLNEYPDLEQYDVIKHTVRLNHRNRRPQAADIEIIRKGSWNPTNKN